MSPCISVVTVNDRCAKGRVPLPLRTQICFSQLHARSQVNTVILLLTNTLFTHLENSVVEFFEQCSHFFASFKVTCVVKKKFLQLRDEFLLDFHHQRSFTLTRLWNFAFCQFVEFSFHLKPAVNSFYVHNEVQLS